MITIQQDLLHSALNAVTRATTKSTLMAAFPLVRLDVHTDGILQLSCFNGEYITGDVTEVDLPGGVTSGLGLVRDILTDLDDVHFAELTAVDVVRNRLVGAIVDAYGRWDDKQPKGPRR